MKVDMPLNEETETESNIPLTKKIKLENLYGRWKDMLQENHMFDSLMFVC